MAIDAAALSQWFQERPLWMREALKLLLANGTLSQDNLKALAETCRKQGDVKKPAVPEPWPAGAFTPKTASQTVRLKSISEPKGIDALNPRTPLLFGPEAVTIVYGHTGSGKSGYIRILNNICGSKNRRALLGNVFQGPAAQTCKLAYEVDGAAKELLWQPSLGQQPDLGGLEIYDTECGNVYVNAENEVAFEPWLLGLFQRLIDACGQIDGILTREVAAAVTAKPVIPAESAGTAGAVWYAGLTAATISGDITAWTTWTPKQQEELIGLQARLLEKNPSDQARVIRIRIAAVQKFANDWKESTAALAREPVQVFLDAKSDAATKRKAAGEDAAKVFAQAPLGGVGLESWQLLWQQARAYSEKIAYPDRPFPVVGGDARCVLCQQPLDEDAGSRLGSFERFVKGELEVLAQAAEKKVGTLLAALPILPSSEDLTTRLATIGVDDPSVTKKLHAYRDGLASRCAALPDARLPVDVPALPDLNLLGDLPEMVQALEKKAKAFEDDAAKTDKTALKKQTRELEARQWLSEQKAAVEAEHARLKKVAGLEAARRLVVTTALSTKKSELAEQLVSQAFIQRFQAELKILGATRIRVELAQTRTAKGHVFHQIQLKGAKLKASTSEVLSEGERRIVSLAAFLADVEGIEANTPFVFDDPISSLDQDYEESVVARLVALAKKRQVIVFTHRLSLLGLLEEVGKAEGVATRVVALNRETWGTGEPGETPFFARTPQKVVKALINERLPKARKVLETVGRTEYEILAKALCSEIRILTERLVEDTLLNEVVRRFRRSVQTLNRIEKLAKITPADCQLVDEFMTKYSRHEHSQSLETPVPLPDPDEIAADLVRLQTWLDEFTDRKVP